MQNYSTTEEKAAEWDISSRYIQYLCRAGKIPGAIKRAGSWFIPIDSPLPLKNTKSNVSGFKFVGTKSKIFESAITLFMLRGFNDVSLRDIAESVGIRQSTIYNHFKSKQEILDTIYDFFCHYYLVGCPDIEEMKVRLQSENLEDIIKAIRYDFPEECRGRMLDITKIIFQRVPIDERARQIGKSLMIDKGVEYVDELFSSGIERGRFKQFDTRLLAIYINSIRIFTLYHWVLDLSADDAQQLAKDEHMLFLQAIKALDGYENQP